MRIRRTNISASLHLYQPWWNIRMLRTRRMNFGRGPPHFVPKDNFALSYELVKGETAVRNKLVTMFLQREDTHDALTEFLQFVE